MGDNQITKSGLENLQKELHTLKEEKRPSVVDRLQKARAMGDLKENSEYQDARESLNLLDERIHEIESKIASAEVVESATTTGTVQLGNTVVVDANGQVLEYIIVGEMESDITQRKISHTSPLGRALIGKGLSEEVEVIIPVGTMKYLIIEIR